MFFVNYINEIDNLKDNKQVIYNENTFNDNHSNKEQKGLIKETLKDSSNNNNNNNAFNNAFNNNDFEKKYYKLDKEYKELINLYSESKEIVNKLKLKEVIKERAFLDLKDENKNLIEQMEEFKLKAEKVKFKLNLYENMKIETNLLNESNSSSSSFIIEEDLKNKINEFQSLIKENSNFINKEAFFSKANNNNNNNYDILKLKEENCSLNEEKEILSKKIEKILKEKET